MKASLEHPKHARNAILIVFQMELETDTRSAGSLLACGHGSPLASREDLPGTSASLVHEPLKAFISCGLKPGPRRVWESSTVVAKPGPYHTTSLTGAGL